MKHNRGTCFSVGASFAKTFFHSAFVPWILATRGRHRRAMASSIRQIWVKDELSTKVCRCIGARLLDEESKW